MEPSHYLAIRDISYETHNKLQKAALEYFNSIDRVLIYAEDLPALQSQILQKIAELNAAHPRCKSINITFDVDRQTRDIRVAGFYQQAFYLRTAKFNLIHTHDEKHN
jgi:hypothetical protein